MTLSTLTERTIGLLKQKQSPLAFFLFLYSKTPDYIFPSFPLHLPFFSPPISMAMARSAAVVFLIFLVLSASFLANGEGSSRKLLISSSSRKLLISSSSRKLLISTSSSSGGAGDSKEGGSGNSYCSWLRSTFLGALSMGRVPYSAPSNKGHATTLDNESLFRRHLARIDRILQSVPSPGVGH